MYSFEEMCELIRLVASSGVANVEIEQGDFRVRVKGVQRPTVVASDTLATVTTPMGEVSHQPSESAVSGSSAPAGEEEDGLHFVSSPIVGTFYRAPNPDADPYVRAGDFVKEGQTLCIVEAMKLMNEIECDVAGTVVKVFPENAQPVEYGARLFAVRPA